MATKTRSKSNDSSRNENNAGVLVGAAVAGAAVGLAANLGRKLFVQFSTGTTGNWLDTLKFEHEMVLALFDKLQATDDDQTGLRSHLLGKIKHALSKHAAEEENVIYPALREADERQPADRLTSAHGYVKTYLYELEGMNKYDAAFLTKVADFRTMLEQHIRDEEDDIFPRFLSGLSDEKNKDLTARMNKEGFEAA